MTHPHQHPLEPGRAVRDSLTHADPRTADSAAGCAQISAGQQSQGMATGPRLWPGPERQEHTARTFTLTNDQTAALRRAVTAGMAPIDAARVAGVPLPPHYDHCRARTCAYWTVWHKAGDERGVQTTYASGQAVRETLYWRGPGWHLEPLDRSGRVDPRAAEALDRLIAAFDGGTDGEDE